MVQGACGAKILVVACPSAIRAHITQLCALTHWHTNAGMHAAAWTGAGKSQAHTSHTHTHIYLHTCTQNAYRCMQCK